MFAFAVFPFVILGMLKARDDREQYVSHIWFLSVCAYFVIAATLNFVHEYHQIPMVPVGSLFIVKYLADFVRQRPGSAWISDKKIMQVVLMLAFIPFHSIY